jgi:hypothetical protein
MRVANSGYNWHDVGVGGRALITIAGKAEPQYDMQSWFKGQMADDL